MKDVFQMQSRFSVNCIRRFPSPILYQDFPILYAKITKYICIFYDEDRKKALKEMQRYVKRNGFVTPDKQYTVADVVLREREATGKVVSITPYHKLFDTVTDELKEFEAEG